MSRQEKARRFRFHVARLDRLSGPSVTDAKIRQTARDIVEQESAQAAYRRANQAKWRAEELAAIAEFEAADRACGRI